MPPSRQARAFPTVRESRRDHAFTPAKDREAQRELVRRLWEEQQAHHEICPHPQADMAYLKSHLESPIAVERQLRIFETIARHARAGQRILEWGCRHGLDSALLRQRFGDTIELSGCDVCEGVAFAPFHESSELEYSKLEHPWRLPYAEHTFDVAISNGVLEHVPDDVASLRELARVLVPGGILFITCLPNRWSYTEAIQRARGVTSHDRLYTLGAIREMLREAGFATSEPKRFLMVPSLLHGLPDWVREAYNRSGPLVWACNDVLERVWPLGLLASNLSIVAHKHGG